MSLSLYLAFAPGTTLPALLVAAKQHQPEGIAVCRSALLFPTRQSEPVLREFTALLGTAAGTDPANELPDELLHRFTISQATCDAREASLLIVPNDFKQTAWLTLLRWVLLGNIAYGAVVTAANHVGDMDSSGELRRVAQTLRPAHD